MSDAVLQREKSFSMLAHTMLLMIFAVSLPSLLSSTDDWLLAVVPNRKVYCYL
jgi:hypothetical protein